MPIKCHHVSLETKKHTCILHFDVCRLRNEQAGWTVRCRHPNCCSTNVGPRLNVHVDACLSTALLNAGTHHAHAKNPAWSGGPAYEGQDASLMTCRLRTSAEGQPRGIFGPDARSPRPSTPTSDSVDRMLVSCCLLISSTCVCLLNCKNLVAVLATSEHEKENATSKFWV